MIAAGAFVLSVTTVFAQDGNVTRPDLLLKEHVVGMPKGDRQEVKVLTATIRPGRPTVFHTHCFPVTVYILEGSFTLKMDGRPPVTVNAGEAMIEPPNVKMTGYNRSAKEPMRVVIFYVSDLDTPFLDPIKHVNWSDKEPLGNAGELVTGKSAVGCHHEAHRTAYPKEARSTQVRIREKWEVAENLPPSAGNYTLLLRKLRSGWRESNPHVVIFEGIPLTEPKTIAQTLGLDATDSAHMQRVYRWIRQLREAVRELQIGGTSEALGHE